MWTRRAARLALVAGTALLGTAGPAAAAAMRLALEGAGEANSDTQSMEATAGRTGVTVIAEATDELPGWRLDIAPPVGQKLQVGRIYEGMVRAGQQTAAVGGVLLVRDGLTCDVVEGRVAIKELTIGAGGRVTRLAATILQRCDGSPDAKSGSVVVTQPAEPPVLRPSQPGGSVFAGGESGAPGRAGYALAFTAHGEARLRRGRSDIRLFTARGGRSFSGDVDASVVTWQTTRRVAGVECPASPSPGSIASAATA